MRRRKMRGIFLKYTGGLCIFLLALCFNIQISAAAGGNVVAINPELQKSIDSSQKNVENWLTLVDQGRYDLSWEEGAKKFQMTMPKDGWVKIVESWREPLGALEKRNLADIRVAENPPGMPAGQYLVYVYQSSFQNKKDVVEVLTITQNETGEWKVLTYNLK